MSNFWQKLEKPFTVLAPMDDVTDVSFREMLTITARPDIFFTEFTNCDGIFYDKSGKVLEKLIFTTNQRPIVAQIWGTNPKTFEEAAKKIKELGFDGIDINMGCPVKDVVKHGGGSALIKTPQLAKELISAVKGYLPISVKTRLGFDKVITDEWISFLLEQKLDALIIHGRTQKQMSSGEANWDEIGRAVTLKNKISPSTIIVGNGDIFNYSQALEKYKTFGVDGVMIGRGLFRNPYAFDKTESHANLAIQERINLAIRHTEIFNRFWENKKDFNILKKFYKTYISDFSGSKELRMELMQTKTITDVLAVLKYTSEKYS
ncbi:tRNA-dihydrouridine synthase [Candidatus Microgenomates bacterium]|nr:tRNA-dihydrouridine synthase [Candidatus Microgenomates bacterium]